MHFRTIPAAATAVLIAALLAAPVGASAQASPEDQLRATLMAQLAQAPETSGAYVVDLGDGHVVLDDRSGAKLLSASVTKLYTTSTALLELGPRARAATRVLGVGRRVGSTWEGDLYLRGGGDFTFGTASFASKAYGSHASVGRLAAALQRSGLRRISGDVRGDASLYTDNGGTAFELVLCPDPLFGPNCPYGPAGQLERPLPNGPRTPIGFDRGLLGATGAEPQLRPATFAADGLVRALAAAGITVDGGAASGRTPAGARVLATTRSPSMARLITLINRPSDNYAADSLFRLIGARVDRDGSGEGGARVVSHTIERTFGLAPDIESGSGETILDRTSPSELVRLLAGMARRPEAGVFARSLSQAGESGTLLRFKGTVAEGRCQLKDGTRVDADVANTTLNITGYCTSLSGRRFAFAFMMNRIPLEFIPPDQLESPGYPLQNAFVEALAGYRG